MAELNAQQRREEIRQILSRAQGPLSAGVLAEKLGVSRQIVVGDVALLRASGVEIEATPRGYLCRGGRSGEAHIIACCHSSEEELRRELYAVVDNGGVVEDVTIENPLYGELTGRLRISSRYEADLFIHRAMEQPDSLLSRMTGGIHLHTILCDGDAAFESICEALRAAGVLCEKEL